MAKALQLAIKNFKEHMQDRESQGHAYPACFTRDEFRAWKLHEEEMPTLPIRSFTCRDCVKSYQIQMTSEGRCCNATIDLDKITD